MKHVYFTFVLVLILGLNAGHAQVTMLKAPAIGDNKKAMVGERIGITDVTINYDRPGVKGREGHIYGTPIVHKGFENLGFGTSKASPWRAGANENTIITFSTPVKIEGKDLPAGKYGFFVAYDPDQCTVIFSKNSTSWGSYFYSETEDVLRVKVKPVNMPSSVERLKYEFIDQTPASAVIALEWEKVRIPFKVEVDLVQTELADFREELRGSTGFHWESFEQAASFCLANNVITDEALGWSAEALNAEKNFQTMSLKAEFLEKMGKRKESDSLMNKAMGIGTMQEIHQYGKSLLTMNRKAEALTIFKLNAKNHPKQFTTSVGLARGYSANGDYKNALVNAQAALPLAPDPFNKKAVEEMIEKLKAGKDVN